MISATNSTVGRMPRPETREQSYPPGRRRENVRNIQLAQ
jgi:hypothetical protein